MRRQPSARRRAGLQCLPSNPRERLTRTHPRSATCASMVVAAGRYSDFGIAGIPSPLRDSAGIAPASPFNKLLESGLTCSHSVYRMLLSPHTNGLHEYRFLRFFILGRQQSRQRTSASRRRGGPSTQAPRHGLATMAAALRNQKKSGEIMRLLANEEGRVRAAKFAAARSNPETSETARFLLSRKHPARPL